MKTDSILIAVGIFVIVLLIGWVQHLKAQVAYADFNCPVCGSDEVLDFGETEYGRHSQCFDCKTEFYTQETEYDYD